MSDLLALHLCKLFRLGRVILLQPVREIVVNVRVLFLLGNGQGQDFLLAEAIK